MKCQVCNQETLLPFRCPFCGGQFCSTHRLPENHSCPRIDFARSQRQEQVITPQAYNSYQYSYNLGPPKRSNRITTTPKELQHIAVAAALVIGIGFSIGLYGNYFGGFTTAWTWAMMGVFAAIMTVSFLTHEIAHKIFAQKAGMWAEFRLTTWGAVLTFISIFLPFRMISPGAMMISGTPSSKEMIKISVAGVITNMIYSVGILGAAFALAPSGFATMLFFAAYINAFMAIFNLIPFGVLDGFKLFMLNKKLWALAFTVAAALTAIAVYYSFVVYVL
jgi:Zn-dependent protease